MASPKTVEIYVIESDFSPVTISVDGAHGRASAIIPLGKSARIDARLIPILETSEGIKWRYAGTVMEEPELAVEPTFDADSIIEGTVADVVERLASLTPQQLVSVRDAETDREVPRKGVREAIDKAIAASNQE